MSRLTFNLDCGPVPHKPSILIWPRVVSWSITSWLKSTSKVGSKVCVLIELVVEKDQWLS